MTLRSTDPIVVALEELLQRPKEEQVDAALALITALPDVHDEAWNSSFGPGSLFDAWTQTSIASGVHQLLAKALRPVISQPGFVAIEVGAGDGRTWASAWNGDEIGTLVVIDPVESAIARVAATAPAKVKVVPIPTRVEQATLPAADRIVCSMTLHHLAGRDTLERERFGFTGPGKAEVLESFKRSVRERDGQVLLVEADVDCELHLPPGDPGLRDNLFDSYVRRCASSILHDLEHRAPPPPLRRAWLGLLQHWFLAQLKMADVPREERDVYELTVSQWRDLFNQVGFHSEHQAADDWGLFQLYQLR